MIQKSHSKAITHNAMFCLPLSNMAENPGIQPGSGMSSGIHCLFSFLCFCLLSFLFSLFFIYFILMKTRSKHHITPFTSPMVYPPSDLRALRSPIFPCHSLIIQLSRPGLELENVSTMSIRMKNVAGI